MKNTPLGLVAIAPSPSQPKKQSQQRPNVWRWWLLMVWGLLPLFSQAQCVTSFGSGSIVSTSAMTNKVLVVMRTSVVLTGAAATCSIRPAAGTLAALNDPTSIIKFGVTVDFTKVKFRHRGDLPSSCSVSGDGTLNFAYVCLPGNLAKDKRVSFDVEYLLEGKSTTTTDVDLFTPSLTSYTALNNSSTYFTPIPNPYSAIKVPKSAAPTCSTAINPTFLNLGTIRPTDLTGSVGSSTTSGQKTFRLSISCMADALSTAITLVPTFQFSNPLSQADFDIARAVVGTDLGFGFKLLDPKGVGIKSGVALNNAPFAFNTPKSLQLISNDFTVQYAKTQTTVNAGVVSATILITIGFL